MGRQRREAPLWPQDNWVQARRKRKRGPRAQSKEKADFSRGVELRGGSREREGAGWEGLRESCAAART